MRIFFISLSILSCVLGSIFIMKGCNHPSKYEKELSKKMTTAVRVTQVYSEATHTVVVGIGFVSLAILFASMGRLVDNNELKQIFERIFGRNSDHPGDSQDE